MKKKGEKTGKKRRVSVGCENTSGDLKMGN